MQRYAIRAHERQGGARTDGTRRGIRLAVRGGVRLALLLSLHLSLQLGILLVGGGLALAEPPQVLVATGDRAPSGLPFSRFSDVALDDRGRVVFVGASAAIFQRRGVRIAHVVGANDTLNGRIVAGVGPPALAGNGCLAFRAEFVGGGPAIYRRCGEVSELVATVGRATPGGTALLGFGQDVMIGRGGQVAFTALLEGGSTGLFVADGPTAVTEVTRTGAPAPAGGTFLSVRPVGVSAQGHVGFRGTVSAGPDGLFAWNGGAVVPLAVVGDASPAGGRFTAVGAASMNDQDQWAFRGTVTRAGPARALDGVFGADTATAVPRFTIAALEGDPSPLGGTFRDIPTSLVPTINGQGTIAFRASVAGGTASAGVFVIVPDGPLAKVVAVGDTVAAGGPREGERLVRLRDPALADDGSVLVRASIARGAPGLFVVRDGQVKAFALLADATDLGLGFRFNEASVRGAAEEGVFLGVQEGVYIAVAPGEVRPLAMLGDPTPIGGTYAGFETPAAGAGARIVFGGAVAGGRANEALFTVGRRGPALLFMGGARVPGGGEAQDLFADPLDGLSRSGVGLGGVAFHAALRGTTAATGLFVRTGRRVKAVARAGQRAPTGGRYASFGTPAVVRGGQVAFVATVGTGEAAVFLRSGARTRALAVAGRETGTRLGGRFLAFDPPAASTLGVAFRATLGQEGLDGIFLATGRGLIALVGSGDARADGDRWRSFATPTFAGRGVVFRAEGLGGAGAGLYRVALGRHATPGAVPPILEQLSLVGQPTPLGGTFVAFGTPSGSRGRAVAFTADLLSARAASAVLLQATAP